MGEGFYFVDILIFAMVAAFLVYRLRSVLGRRHGEERQRPNPFAQRPPQAPGTPTDDGDNVVQLPDRGRGADMPTRETPATLADGVRQIRAADPAFNERHFLHGARAAFEMIVGAFAAADTATLRPLLADDVYDNFAEAIRQRQAAGETLTTELKGFEGVELLDARMDGRHAICQVRFTTRQINVTRDSQGNIMDGDPDQALEVVDIWTFSRNVRSKDPNWLLVETRTGN